MRPPSQRRRRRASGVSLPVCASPLRVTEGLTRREGKLVSGAGKGFAYSFTALCLLGMVFAGSLEALKPLCGGRRVTIASNDRSIHGTRGPDVIVGGRGPNTIHGGGGNDVICGGYGRDRIYGGRGNDTIDDKKDADLVHGGRGS